jgi:hypothetical protein
MQSACDAHNSGRKARATTSHEGCDKQLQGKRLAGLGGHFFGTVSQAMRIIAIEAQLRPIPMSHFSESPVWKYHQSIPK